MPLCIAPGGHTGTGRCGSCSGLGFSQSAVSMAKQGGAGEEWMGGEWAGSYSHSSLASSALVRRCSVLPPSITVGEITNFPTRQLASPTTTTTTPNISSTTSRPPTPPPSLIEYS